MLDPHLIRFTAHAVEAIADRAIPYAALAAALTRLPAPRHVGPTLAYALLVIAVVFILFGGAS